jgi:UDP-glucose 4-epimerase
MHRPAPVLVTGSAGHLGEALMRHFRTAGQPARGLDVKPSPFTDIAAAVADRAAVRAAVAGAGAVIHTATLHKPHVATHAREDFLDTNVRGTLVLLEEAAAAGAQAFVLSSSTSVLGAALNPAPGAPAAWIDEDVVPVPKNIYGVTKRAAEDLCELFARRHGLPGIVLRIARFFPEEDDDRTRRLDWADANLKANEFLYRRADIADVVSAHLAAAARAPALGFGRYIVSATTPFRREDCAALGRDAAAVLWHRVPEARAAFARLGWRPLPVLDRVYDNARARMALGWQPKVDFAAVFARALRGEPVLGPLAALIGCKGYHDRVFEDGPFPVA